MVASLVVILVFVSATTYYQLAVAILLYIPLAYFALKVLPKKPRRVQPTTANQSAHKEEKVEAEILKPAKEKWNIADIDKRTFLKLIGGAGLALFLYSLFNKKAEGLFFGKAAAESGIVTLQDTNGNKINPAERQPTDGYRISEIDDNIITFYGFTNKDGSWFIMKEDTDTGSFRYSRGDKNFTGSWTNRENLTYDYYSNVF